MKLVINLSLRSMIPCSAANVVKAAMLKYTIRHGNFNSMTITRECLPNRRASTTFGFECSGLQYIATVSRFADGRPAELFLNNSKYASQSDMSARDAAIVTSLALQFGVPIDVLCGAIGRDAAGRPTSPIGCALDAIAGNIG